MFYYTKNGGLPYSYKDEYKENKFLKYENIGNYSCKFKTIFENSEGRH